MTNEEFDKLEKLNSDIFELGEVLNRIRILEERAPHDELVISVGNRVGIEFNTQQFGPEIQEAIMRPAFLLIKDSITAIHKELVRQFESIKIR